MWLDIWALKWEVKQSSMKRPDELLAVSQVRKWWCKATLVRLIGTNLGFKLFLNWLFTDHTNNYYWSETEISRCHCLIGPKVPNGTCNVVFNNQLFSFEWGFSVSSVCSPFKHTNSSCLPLQFSTNSFSQDSALLICQAFHTLSDVLSKTSFQQTRLCFRRVFENILL